jgi:hypothetical protein
MLHAPLLPAPPPQLTRLAMRIPSGCVTTIAQDGERPLDQAYVDDATYDALFTAVNAEHVDETTDEESDDEVAPWAAVALHCIALLTSAAVTHARTSTAQHGRRRAAAGGSAERQRGGGASSAGQ